jgi:DNA polymerase-4
MDAFYASVEQLDNPELHGKPVVVGGAPEHRGVVAAASYEAREFGVRSAMPMSRALRLCPGATRISPRFDRYGEVSRVVMSIFRSLTPLVEPLSLDEAFLDITGRHEEFGGVKGLALHLKGAVRSETGLTVSVGIGTNKTVAKIASDKEKPDGLVIVPPRWERRFLAPLPVRALWGVGPKAEALLNAAGFHTVNDLARANPEKLARTMGSRGHELWEMANGRDPRPVVTDHERKSVGSETTFPRDLPNGPDLREHVERLARDVAQGLQDRDMLAKTVVLKLRNSRFRTITRQASRPAPTNDASEIGSAAQDLLAKAAAEGEMFRLVGVQCTNLSYGEGTKGQLTLLVDH